MTKTVVLYYHSIAPKKKADWPRKYLTHELHVFEAALKYLKRKKYRVIGLEEGLKNNWRFKEKTACLTFDDGFADFYIYVYPLLKKYQMEGTVFVSSEFVEDYRKELLPTLEEYWAGNKNLDDLEYWGYLNWEEMRIMEKSGWVKVESHTATHMKYPYLPKLKDIHHPGSNSLYPIGFLKPELKTKYIREASFESNLPFGYPFFEEKSAVITPIHYPNAEMTKEIVQAFSNYNWDQYSKAEAISIAQPILEKYNAQDEVFERIETQDEMEKRLHYEIITSKELIEKEIGRPLKFLCWPHGDNDERSHKMAIDTGFLATSFGSKVISEDWSDRIPPRFSNTYFKGSIKLGLLKMDLKIQQYQGSGFAKILGGINKVLR